MCLCLCVCGAWLGLATPERPARGSLFINTQQGAMQTLPHTITGSHRFIFLGTLYFCAFLNADVLPLRDLSGQCPHICAECSRRMKTQAACMCVCCNSVCVCFSQYMFS